LGAESLFRVGSQSYEYQWRKRPIERNQRINEQIRISPLRVVDENGQQLGIIPRDQALAAARTAGLDLVEVAPLERPPVCRIMDFGKFKYEQKRKVSKQKTHRIHTKEIRVHPKTGDHDIMVKVNHAREFLQHKDKVLVKVEFRGREIAHIDLGRVVMETILKALEDVAKIEKSPGMEGKKLTALLSPKP